jgi:hypothetical protein
VHCTVLWSRAGLGFSVQVFQDQYDSEGNLKTLITQQTFTDVDGTEVRALFLALERYIACVQCSSHRPLLPQENVWTVVSPRVLQVARAYFDAPELSGLPLLGENRLGSAQSGSHW